MTKKSWYIIIGAYLLVLCGALVGGSLHYDFRLTALSSDESEVYKNYQEYNQEFPVNHNVVTVGLKFYSPLDSVGDYYRLDQFSQRVEKIPEVEKVHSLTNIKISERSFFGVRKRSLVSLSNQRLLNKRIKQFKTYPDVVPKFLSDDRIAACIYVHLDSLSKKEGVQKIQSLARKTDFADAFVIGEQAVKNRTEQHLYYEVVTLPIIASIVLLLLFYILFQDFRSSFIIVSMIALNISIVLITFWLFNIPITILTVTVPLLIVVLSFCDIVHILYHYKKMNPKLSREDRLKRTMQPLKIALWLTSLTTVLAFAVFFLSSVKEIVHFAFVSCIGIIAAYGTARFVLPSFIFLFQVKPFKSSSFSPQLTNWFQQRLSNYKTISLIGCIAAITLLLSALTTSRINVSTYQEVGGKNQSGKGLHFLDSHFSGTRNIEVIIKAEDVFTLSTFNLVDQIEEHLTESYGCRSVFSINTAVKRLNRYKHFGKASFYKIPTALDDDFLEKLKFYKKTLGLVNTVTEDHKLVRIVGRLPEIGSADARVRNERLTQFLDQLNVGDRTVFVSGYSYVRDVSMTQVTRLILSGVLLSVIVAFIVIWASFQSFKIAVVAIIPNLIPLLSAIVLIGLFKMDLNPTSSMALSILLGLSLDDTIYFLRNFYLKRDLPITVDRIRVSIRQNVFPTITTSVILIAGFIVMTFSNFQTNQDLGLLVSLLLVISLASDLILLPALIHRLVKRPS